MQDSLPKCQINKQASKQASRQACKQTNKQTNERADHRDKGKVDSFDPDEGNNNYDDSPVDGDGEINPTLKVGVCPELYIDIENARGKR